MTAIHHLYSNYLVQAIYIRFLGHYYSYLTIIMTPKTAEVGILKGRSLIHTYHIAGKFGGELILGVWRSARATAKILNTRI